MNGLTSSMQHLVRVSFVMFLVKTGCMCFHKNGQVYSDSVDDGAYRNYRQLEFMEHTHCVMNKSMVRIFSFLWHFCNEIMKLSAQDLMRIWNIYNNQIVKMGSYTSLNLDTFSFINSHFKRMWLYGGTGSAGQQLDGGTMYAWSNYIIVLLI